MSNFNVHHLEGLCKARPGHIPTGIVLLGDNSPNSDM